MKKNALAILFLIIAVLLWLRALTVKGQELDLEPYGTTNVLDISALELPVDSPLQYFELSWSNPMVLPDEYNVICVSSDLVNWYPAFEVPVTSNVQVYLASTNTQLFFRAYSKLGP